jgi:phosphatidylserine decarboxylase
MYYNRKTRQVEEDVDYKSTSLNFLYKTLPGRFILWSVVARPWFSNLVSKYQKSKLSKKDIVPFIEKYKVFENKEYVKNTYNSFNEFFTRKKMLVCDELDEMVFISPADSKMQFFEITDDLVLNIKHSKYKIEDILQNPLAAEDFRGGTCIVFRLSVDDYHRYHFIDNGEVIAHKKIPGELHTVRPISEKYNVFTRNAREVTVMRTTNFGIVAQIEVGALLVGKIVNADKKAFSRFDEKGYFEFGGSTIVLLLNKKIKFDEDIMNANIQGLETKVYAGERIGICLKD